jgi:hypothetical protein
MNDGKDRMEVQESCFLLRIKCKERRCCAACCGPSAANIVTLSTASLKLRGKLLGYCRLFWRCFSAYF